MNRFICEHCSLRFFIPDGNIYIVKNFGNGEIHCPSCGTGSLSHAHINDSELSSDALKQAK